MDIPNSDNSVSGAAFHHLHAHGVNHEDLGEYHNIPNNVIDKDEENEGEHKMPEEITEKDPGEHEYPGMIRQLR